jgi:hypothetical protein
MALLKGTNCYVTLSEADSYFEDRLDVAAWEDADCELKEQALTTATAILDDMAWAGQVKDIDQSLAFPRAGSFMDTSRGLRVSFSTYTFVTTDEEESSLKRDMRLLRKATYELAYHLVNNGGLMDRTGSVENIKVGSIEITEVQDASVFPSIVRKIVAPMLRNNTRYWRGW